MSDEAESKFIQNHFKIRVCEQYKGQSYEVCVCNRKKSEHKYHPDSVEGWSYERNTVLRTCDTYGYIIFTGFDDILVRSHPKFIRFDYMLQPSIFECVYKLLINYWSIPIPMLILSINGGFKRMNFKTNQIKKNFKQGLIDVIKKDKTWIIGGGFNVGIHKLVSDAVHEYRLHQENTENEVTLIGISSWGVVFNNQLLLPDANSSDESHRMREYEYGNIVSNEKGKVALDAHYDCYLFCDDGTYKTYDKEVQFRMELERYVVSQGSAFIVQILFEGGKRALHSAYNALKNKVNIVVIKGSGRAADILSRGLELSSRKFSTNINSILEDYKDKLSINEEEFSNLIIILTDIYFNYKKQIIIHNMFDLNMKLDKSILKAIISGRDEKKLKKTLQLTIRFNCPDIADKKVFSNPNFPTIKPSSINDMFLDVLQNNKFEFVRLFLQNGLEIENVMNKGKLENLYIESMDVERSDCFGLLNDLLSKMNVHATSESKIKSKPSPKTNENLMLQRIGEIIPSISGNILKSKYRLSANPLNASAIFMQDMELQALPVTDSTRVKHNMVVTAQDLLLWALLSGHIELAEIFWEIGKDQVGSALIASSILKNMEILTLKRGDIDLAQKLKNASQKFQDYATNVVSEAYSRNKSKTYDMLVRTLKRWDNMTCIQIAISGNLLDFLNNSACNSYAMKVWMGNMSPFISYWKILLNIPFSLIFIKILITPFINEEEQSKKYVPCLDLSSSIESQKLLKQPKPKKKEISYRSSLKIFYTAPIVKFNINIMSYIMFIVIFSYMNLSELKHKDEIKSIKEVWAEIFVCIYVLSIIIEEIRQVIDQERTGNIIYKFIAYLSGSWNIYDMILILLFLISVIVRHTVNATNFDICRCLFSASLSMFCLRTMQFYFVNKSIGPKVIMIRDMIRDILFFLSIFAIFVLSYGTLAHSLRNPNSNVSILLLKDIVYLPYFQTYGELMLENVEMPPPCNTTNCMIRNGTIMIGFGIFLLLTNVLLINLLIAMFGYTFNQIQGNSGKHWSFIRIQLIEEFYEKPILPPPLNLIFYFFKIFFVLYYKILSKNKIVENNLLVKNLSKDENLRICGYEQFCMEAFLSESNTSRNTEYLKRTGWIQDMTELFEKVTATPDISEVKNSKFKRTFSVQKGFSRKVDQNFEIHK